MSLLPVLLLYDQVFLGRPLRWMEKIPLCAVAAAVACATLAGHAHEAALIPPRGGTRLSHILIVSRANLEYVTSLFLPVDLAPVYYYQRSMIYEPVNFLGVTLIAFVCAYVTIYRRHYAWSFFCLGWFVLMLLPESNTVPLAQLRANRYLYLPSVGFALWVAVGLDHWAEAAGKWRQPTFRWAGFAAAVFAVISHTSAGVWRNDVSAWSRVVERHPWSAVAQGMLGRAYYAQHDAVRAERELQLPDAHLCLAKLYAAHGMTAPAGAHLHRYLELAPNDPEGQGLLAALEPTGDS